ncbi:hypothetical protein [Mesorhizobium sp. CA4]|uniref:hypothetical protein n=1 Tax=Mesorhizobium sp. CA4 TaxID=588499 RepID=UPI001CD091E5|nr:hypothetical protein [Mesorhizobium sp. CA4]MBZ9823212.1 hypothetical protein [Mesorhizobium sp. CA4]
MIADFCELYWRKAATPGRKQIPFELGDLLFELVGVSEQLLPNPASTVHSCDPPNAYSKASDAGAVPVEIEWDALGVSQLI